MSQHPIQTREVRTSERGVRTHYIRVDGSAVAGGTATTNGITLGSEHVTITENGDGDYTLTLNDPGQRIVGCQVTGETVLSVCTASSPSTSSVQIIQTTASTGAALADADFWLEMTLSTSADET